MRMLVDGGVGMEHTSISKHADDFDTKLDHIQARADQVTGLRDARPPQALSMAIGSDFNTVPCRLNCMSTPRRSPRT